ncbi:MAG: MurR/RpiR family transcriptional regulator [Rhodospirillales bacterium]|nr:MurR/RpiR family transcriptional regulator [Rhodospirillales bacterium]
MEYPAVKKDILDRFQELSPQLKLAARYVLDRPDDIALNSMRKVADLAKVQPATMVRLAQTLGYEGYQEFRLPFNNRLRGKTADYALRVKVLQDRKDGNSSRALYDDLLAAGSENLAEAFSGNSLEKILIFCDELLAANHIYVLGLRGSFPVAFAFHYGYGMFRRNATLLDGRAGTFADNLRTLQEGDVVLAVGFSPYTASTVRTLDYALDNGAKLLSLTDSAVSPLAEKAHQALLVPHDSPSFYQSFVAPLAVAEALVAFMAARGGASVLADIEASENQLSQFDAYWEETLPRKRRSRS